MIHAYSAATIQDVERPYVTAPDYDGWLMAKAARALADVALENLQRRGIEQANVILLIGSGNNGADALYAGAHLLAEGHQVSAYLVKNRAHKQALNEFIAQGGVLLTDLSDDKLASADVLIDGVLGTGAKGALPEEIAELVRRVNALRTESVKIQVIACDCPTGLSVPRTSDSAEILKADETVTFIAAKDSLLSTNKVGKLHIIPLGIENDLAQHDPSLSAWNDKELMHSFPQPESSDHKYSRGVCGVLAGSIQYPGAAQLSTKAALNTGCGMVVYSGPEQVAFHIMMQTPEAVIGQKTAEEEKVTAWVVGPGAVGDSRTQDIIGVFASRRPAIIDAAALEPAAQWVIDQGKFTPAQILTPHAGELLRILTWLYALNPSQWSTATNLGEPSKEAIDERPLEWVKLAAALTGSTVMLKGATALIATPTGQAFSYRARTSWLATAGSGDTLSGILGSLLAQYTARWNQTGYTAQEEDYAQLVALGIHIHNLAALHAHHGQQGPVPPSIVNQHIAGAISQFLS